MRIGFIGAGKMATALAKGWLDAELVDSETLSASDPYPQARDAFAEQTGGQSTDDNHKVVANSDVIILAVKPQVLSAVLDDIKSHIGPQHLVISIAAGATLTQIQQGLGKEHRLIRVMPNTPCLVLESASGYCPSSTATEEDVTLLNRLLNAVGRAYRLPEHLLDAVTGLSGSGPAFVAMMIEALSDGGVRVGLPRDVATVLAAQTVLGTAKLVLESNLHPGVLKDMVTSPGGTTIAGLHELERGALRGTIMNAVEAATERSRALGT